MVALYASLSALVISFDSGMSRTVHQQDVWKVDVEHWHGSLGLPFHCSLFVSSVCSETVLIWFDLIWFVSDYLSSFCVICETVLIWFGVCLIVFRHSVPSICHETVLIWFRLCLSLSRRSGSSICRETVALILIWYGLWLSMVILHHQYAARRCWFDSDCLSVIILCQWRQVCFFVVFLSIWFIWLS